MQFIRQNRAILVAAAIVVGGLAVIVLKVIVTEDPMQVVKDSPATNVGVGEEETNDNLDIPEEDTANLPDVKLDKPVEDDEVDTDNVSPQVTSAPVSGSQLSARGFVPVVLEDGGACTYRLLTKSGAQIESVQTEGFADVSSTVCPVGEFDVVELSSGDYVVVLEYSSDNYSGTSAEFEVSI